MERNGDDNRVSRMGWIYSSLYPTTGARSIVNMKIKISALVLLCFYFEPVICRDALLAAEISDGKSIRGVEIRISTEKTNYSPGERINLQIIIVNGSTNNLLFTQERILPEADYTYRVLGVDKQEAPLTRLGKDVLLRTDPFNRAKGVQLTSGQCYTSTIVINQLFDVTIPQTYEVTVSRRFLAKLPTDATETIVSKPAQFSVSRF
jgi:hypothetical protein